MQEIRVVYLSMTVDRRRKLNSLLLIIKHLNRIIFRATYRKYINLRSRNLKYAQNFLTQRP